MAANNKKLAVLLVLVAVGSGVPTFEHLGLGSGALAPGCSGCPPSVPDLMVPNTPGEGTPGYGPPRGRPTSCSGAHCSTGPYGSDDGPYGPNNGPDEKCSGGCPRPEEGQRPDNNGQLNPYEPTTTGRPPVGPPCGDGAPCKNGPNRPGPPGSAGTKLAEKGETKSIGHDRPKMTLGVPGVPLQTPSTVSTGAEPTAKPEDTNPYTGGDKTKGSGEVNAPRVPEKQVEDMMNELRTRPCEIRGDMFSMPEVPEQARGWSFMMVVEVSVDKGLQRKFRYAPCEPQQHGRVVSHFRDQYINGFIHEVEDEGKDRCRLLVEGYEMAYVVLEGTNMRKEPGQGNKTEERVVVACGGVDSCKPEKCQKGQCSSFLETTLVESGGTTMMTGSVFKPCEDKSPCQSVRACAGERCVDQKPMPDLVAAAVPVEVSKVRANPPVAQMLDMIADRTALPQSGPLEPGQPGYSPSGPPQSGPLEPGQPDYSPSGYSPSGPPQPGGKSGSSPPVAPGGRIAGTGNSNGTNSTGLRIGAAGISSSANVMSALAVVVASALALLL